jgi:23S rRNA (guanine745-N1)-methyltransferase
MSIFVCPVCGEGLENCKTSYICEKGHSFDISAQGYVNLLSGKTKSNSGDNAEMMSARTRFLNNGYYTCLKNSICELAVTSLKNNKTGELPLLVDAGCGEGYYTAAAAWYLKENSVIGQTAGIDISKNGIKAAARRDKMTAYAVASIFEMPFANEAADIILSVFAPYCESEFRRVIKKGGSVVLVSPGREHLLGLKTVLYDNPYENVEKFVCPDGFETVDKFTVKDNISVKSADIGDLFLMTPYYWKSPIEASLRLKAIEQLDTPIDFIITVIKKLK